jgi:hypothetical protein
LIELGLAVKEFMVTAGFGLGFTVMVMELVASPTHGPVQLIVYVVVTNGATCTVHPEPCVYPYHLESDGAGDVEPVHWKNPPAGEGEIEIFVV